MILRIFCHRNFILRPLLHLLFVTFLFPQHIRGRFSFSTFHPCLPSVVPITKIFLKIRRIICAVLVSLEEWQIMKSTNAWIASVHFEECNRAQIHVQEKEGLANKKFYNLNSFECQSYIYHDSLIGTNIPYITYNIQHDWDSCYANILLNI